MRIQFKQFCCATAILLACGGIHIANAQTNTITTDHQTELNVAIYNANIALIKDTRSLPRALPRHDGQVMS